MHASKGIPNLKNKSVNTNVYAYSYTIFYLLYVCVCVFVCVCVWVMTASHRSGLVGLDVWPPHQQRHSDVKLIELPLVHGQRELA